MIGYVGVLIYTYRLHELLVPSVVVENVIYIPDKRDFLVYTRESS